MIRLAAIIFVLAGTVLAGAAVTAVLAMNMANAKAITAAFVLGLLLAVPVALVLGARMNKALKRS